MSRNDTIGAREPKERRYCLTSSMLALVRISTARCRIDLKDGSNQKATPKIAKSPKRMTALRQLLLFRLTILQIMLI